MKKVLSGIIALILTLSMLFVGALAESADLTGEWYANFYGIAVTMTLNEDGSYAMQMNMEGEEPDEGTWELDGTTVFLDKGTEAEMTLTYDSEAVSLYAEQEGMEFLFTREMPEAFEAAPARADAALEEFAGAWACTLVDAMGMQAAPDVIGLDLSVRIEDGFVTLLLPELLEEEVALEGEFADGVLTVTIPAESEYSEDSIFVIQLLEDGTMSVSMSFVDEPIVFYMAAEGTQP